MPIRVMTYNVRYFGHASRVVRGAASTRRGIMLITDAIARLERLPHVICLQEVETRSLRSALSHTPSHIGETQLEAVMKSLDHALHRHGQEHRYRAHYFPAHAYQVGKQRIYTTGLAVLTREDVQVDLHNAEDPHDITHRRKGPIALMKQSRICAHVTVARGGDTIDVFNTHLSLPAFISRDLFRIARRMGYGKNQEKEIEALARFVEAKRTSDRYLVVGDFNSLPGSPSYNLIQERLKVRDPFPEVFGHTLQDLLSAWPTAGFLTFRMRLDHIFAGPGLEWLDFEDTHPYGLESGQWHELSDHVPIVGRFKIKRPMIVVPG